MILLQSHSRFLLDTLLNRLQKVLPFSQINGLLLLLLPPCHPLILVWYYHWAELDDVRYHIQVTMKNPHILLPSVSLTTPPPETVFLGAPPSGAIEAAYGAVVKILDPQRDGFNLTLKLNLSELPPDEEVMLGAPLRVLKKLAARTVASNTDELVALLH